MPADADAAALLRERAERLARPPADAAVAGEDVLICQVGGERYAVDLNALRAVLPSRQLTPIPCTPAFVAGALNVRGEVVTVLDLAVALGLPSAGAAEAGQILLVELPELKVGLLVDLVLGIERLAPERLDRTMSGRDFMRGIADGTTIYLNLPALLSDERFVVVEEVN